MIIRVNMLSPAKVKDTSLVLREFVLLQNRLEEWLSGLMLKPLPT